MIYICAYALAIENASQMRMRMLGKTSASRRRIRNKEAVKIESLARGAREQSGAERGVRGGKTNEREAS